MKSLPDLLTEKGKIDAATHLVGLILKHDLWAVGGTARYLISDGGVPYPGDIDLLANIDVPAMTATCKIDMPSDAKSLTGSSGDGQKYELDGVAFDLFEQRLIPWLAGTPCFGDMIAVRLSDSRVVCLPEALLLPPYGRNPAWSGPAGYFETHSKSLERDKRAIGKYIATTLNEYDVRVTKEGRL